MHSNLGEPLWVQVPLTGASEDILVASCLKTKVETIEGQLIDVPRIEFIMPSQPDRPVYVSLTSKKSMDEPAIRFSIAMVCGASVKRDYTLLLDFPESPTAHAPTPAVSDNPPTARAPGSQLPAPPKPLVTALKQPKPVSAVVNAAKEVPAIVTKTPLPKTRHKTAIVRDVLRVENDDAVTEPDLKMSRMLSDSGTPNPDQQRTEENRLAQARFAAIMRGEDPMSVTQGELGREQVKTKNLQNELEKIKQQDVAKDASGKSSSTLLTSLIAAVSALLVALVGLIVYALRRSRKTEVQTWWDPSAEQKKNVADIVDYLQSSAEKGNLDPGPITATRDASASEKPGKVDVPDTAVKPSETTAFKRTGLPALEDTNSSTFNFFGHRGHSIHIEEVSDITQEAEFWLSVNDPHRAIEILEPQSRDDNPGTPVPWLYLLDLYRLVGDEENYRDLRQRFKHKFNAKIPEFNEEIILDSARSFEDFPHLIATCCALWNTDDIGGYLESLLVDDREGERIGFDLPVYRDILFLLAISNELARVKYHPATKKEESVLIKKPEPVLTPLEEHLIVKPGPANTVDLDNSLDFDILDFKEIGKEKN